MIMIYKASTTPLPLTGTFPLLVFRWKYLTLLFQIPHSRWAMLKFPTSPCSDDSQMPLGCPAGGTGGILCLVT